MKPTTGGRFMDATGFPVLPSLNGLGKPYWYRTDISERERWARKNLGSRSEDAQAEFYSSSEWKAVQDLFDHPDYPETENEIAFEVPPPRASGGEP